MRGPGRSAETIILAACLLAGCGGVPKVDYSAKKLAADLKHNDPKMRYWAAESLGHYGSEAEAAVPDLVAALKDEDKMVRMGVAYALAEIGPPAEPARDALTAATNDPEKEVRDAATYALRQISAKTPPKTQGRK